MVSTSVSSASDSSTERGGTDLGGHGAQVQLGARQAIRGMLAFLVLLVTIGLVVQDDRGRPGLYGLVLDLRDEQGFENVEERMPAIRAAAQEAGVDPMLVAAIMWCESRGVSGRTSKADALGLMQLMLPSARDAAKRLGLPEPSARDVLRDDALNLRLGTAHLAWLQRSDPAWSTTAILVAYNTGRGRLKRWIQEAGGYEAWAEGQRTRVRKGERPSPAWVYAQRVLAAREELELRAAAPAS